MSQAGFLKAKVPPHPVGILETLTGNAGGAVGPDILNNIDIIGSGPLSITGDPIHNSLSIIIATATTAILGATTLATNAETIAGAVSTHAVTPTSLAAKLGTQTVDAIPYGNGTGNAINWTAAGTNGQILIAATAGAPAFASVTAGNNIGITGGANTLAIAVNGTTNHAVQIGNGTNSLSSLAVGTNGQVLLAATGANPAFATLTSTGATITFTPGANTLNLEANLPASGTFPTDSGTATPAAGVLNIDAQNASNGCGSSVLFSAPGASNTVQLNVTDANNSTFVGQGAGNLAPLFATNDSVALGYHALNATSGSHYCTAVGYNSLVACTTSQGNTAVGTNSLYSLMTAAGNAGYNTSLGINSGSYLVTGQYNCLLGQAAGSQYGGAESSNIIVGNIGLIGESNVIKIGTQGSGNAQQNTCYIAGITGVNVGSVANVVSIATGTGQLGTTAITAGMGISVTPGANTITIAATGAGFTWTREAGAAISMGADHGYINTNAGLTTFALPALAAVGDAFSIMGESAGGWLIAQNAGQNIQFGSLSSTPGVLGSLASSNRYDCIELICRVANTTFQVVSAVGNLTIV